MEAKIGSEDPIYDISETVSSSECTGLMPAGIDSDGQAEAYGELYAIHPPKQDSTDQ